jgi:hypothetical protein
MATKLIGTAANQVPTNGSLGSMAFQDKESVRVDNLTVDSYCRYWYTNRRGNHHP